MPFEALLRLEEPDRDPASDDGLVPTLRRAHKLNAYSEIEPARKEPGCGSEVGDRYAWAAAAATKKERRTRFSPSPALFLPQGATTAY